MPVIAFLGKQGSGKTLSMIREALISYCNKMTIYSNLKLIGIKYEPIDLNWFMGYLLEKKELRNVCVLIDELQLYADCRSPKSKINRVLGYFALQTRKRNVKFLFTTQYFENVDRRIRRCVMDDVIVRCEGKYVYNEEKKEPELKEIKQTIVFDGCSKYYTQTLTEPSKFFKYYVTGEVLPILE